MELMGSAGSTPSTRAITPKDKQHSRLIRKAFPPLPSAVKILWNNVCSGVRPIMTRTACAVARHSREAMRAKAGFDVWPIEPATGTTPPHWPGWPENKKFAVVITHDVKRPRGLARVDRMIELETRYGFRSSFNLVTDGAYQVSDDLLYRIEQAGFEVGMHGLNSRRKRLFSKAGLALEVGRLRDCVSLWGASGFSSTFFRRNMAWMHLMGIEYDSSAFDADPFEQESDSAGTIFPFWVPGPGGGFVELPRTLAQDHTLFNVLLDRDIEVWKRKLDWIAARGGMALMNVHPDGTSFDGQPGADEYPVSFYERFLQYVRNQYAGEFWHALPREVARHYTRSLPVASRNTRKKICMVAYSYYESDNRVRRYAEALASRGDQVEVIALGNESTSLGEVDIGGVRLRRIQHRVRDEGGKWTYALRLLRFLVASSVVVTRRHNAIRYDLLHIHNVPDFLILAGWYAKWRGAKTILDIHDIVPELFANKFGTTGNNFYVKLMLMVEKASASFADHVIVSNHLWYQKLVLRSVPAEKCSVVVNHVDTGIFYRRLRTRHDDKYIIVFPGTFQWHQGLDVAIEALAHLKNKVPNVELHLYGGGAGRASLECLADRLGIADRVIFHGYVPLDSVPGIIANADIGIVPKRADSFGNEAYSTKIMEFMSQGVPVVVSKTKIDSYYFDENVVRFFPSGDSMAMAEAMFDVMQDQRLRQTLVERGIAYADQNSWEMKKSDYLELVDALTADSFAGMDGPEWKELLSRRQQSSHSPGCPSVGSLAPQDR